jgi:hypothetical protein
MMAARNGSWWDENNAEYSANTPQDPTSENTPAPPGAGGYPFDAQFAAKVQEWYKTYLGRAASDAEINSHWGNPNGLAGTKGVFETISTSPEATAYKASQKPSPTPNTPGAPGGGGSVNLANFGNMGQSGVWDGRFDFPTYTPPVWTAGNAPGTELPTFTAPEFDAPTSDEVTSDEGFKARLALGQSALERSAAAKGTLLTSGTMKGINQFAQDYGSAEYEKAFERALKDYQADYGGKWDEYQAKFNASGTNYTRAKDAYDAKYSTAANTYGAAKDKYLQSYGEWLTDDTNKFSRNYNLAQLGLGASQYGSISA